MKTRDYFLGKHQNMGVGIYISDPCHDDAASRAVAAMHDELESTLRVPAGSERLTINVLIDAANSADAHIDGKEPDRQVRDALTALAARIQKGSRR